MLASFPARMVNQKPADLGIPNRFSPNSSRFSRPIRADMMDRARALVPALRAKALQTERDRVIPPETHRAFQEAGFYKVFQPVRYGGYEMSISMLVEIGGELGRGCGSSA